MHIFTAQFMFLQLVLGDFVTYVWVTVNTLTHYLRGFSKRQYHHYNENNPKLK